MKNYDFISLRNDLNLTQLELAQKSGVPVRTIQKIENQELLIANLTFKNAAALCRTLAVTADELLSLDA